MTRVSLAAQIIRHHDIRVISAYNLLLGAPAGAIAAEMYRLPLVVTNLGEIYSHRAESELQLPMIRHIIRRATALTSLTRHCADSYRELGISPDVRVLHYGIDRQRFAAAASGDDIRSRYGIAPDADVVLYVGRLVRDMGLQVLLDGIPLLLARRPSIHVVIAGGAGELMDAARAASSTWPNRVAVAVDVPEDALARYYAAATLVVAPTIGARACGSLTSAEAMAAGKPVVATRIGGIPEYVTDGVTGLLVPPGDVDSLVEATVGLLADRTRLAEFGRRGRERVAELFDADRTNAALESLFREVAGIR
jgi:glycosyltransferase involved in cell wall biosynthesis